MLKDYAMLPGMAKNIKPNEISLAWRSRGSVSVAIKRLKRKNVPL